MKQFNYHLVTGKNSNAIKCHWWTIIKEIIIKRCNNQKNGLWVAQRETCESLPSKTQLNSWQKNAWVNSAPLRKFWRHKQIGGLDCSLQNTWQSRTVLFRCKRVETAVCWPHGLSLEDEDRENAHLTHARLANRTPEKSSIAWEGSCRKHSDRVTPSNCCYGLGNRHLELTRSFTA